jgi:hypothetical protein
MVIALAEAAYRSGAARHIQPPVLRGLGSTAAGAGPAGDLTKGGSRRRGAPSRIANVKKTTPNFPLCVHGLSKF